jgi:predicted phosphodiesterase
MRVDTLDLDGLKVKYIGDVHLGRRFQTGVPLHRRGEREKMVLEQFKAELLDVGDARVVIQVGDIFDKFTVSNDIVDAAWQVITDATGTNPDVNYIFIRGNHDASKDLEKVSSFHILEGLCAPLMDVNFVTKLPLVFENLAFIPYDPIITAADMVKMVRHEGKLSAVFGHWDLKSFGENSDTDNLIPIEQLKLITDLAVTGHDHKPYEFDVGTLTVLCTGSMQPYAHGEEADDEENKVYRTLTLAQLAELEPLQPDVLRDKCVRILLSPGEVLPADLDCLQLTAKRVGAEGEEETLDVEMGEFDMDGLFVKAFTDVAPDVAAIFLAKFKELRQS